MALTVLGPAGAQPGEISGVGACSRYGAAGMQVNGAQSVAKMQGYCCAWGGAVFLALVRQAAGGRGAARDGNIFHNLLIFFEFPYQPRFHGLWAQRIWRSGCAVSLGIVAVCVLWSVLVRRWGYLVWRPTKGWQDAA